jgi:hypothetical protein
VGIDAEGDRDAGVAARTAFGRSVLERNRDDVLDEVPPLALIMERGRAAMDRHPAPEYQPIEPASQGRLVGFYGPPS